jgi:ATP-dependent helicase/nuclease subunit A
MPPLTPQQSRAVLTRDVSVVLSSGAGCGKTHVLTERYLAHLREGAEVAQVVAITFTERAARQMRGRIRAAVMRHLRDAPDDAASETWARHLRALENAPISTIHAFCGNLLRQHSLKAGLDPAFAVLEEILSVNLRSAALADALQRLLVAESPAALDLRELVLLYGWRPVGATVDALAYAHDAEAWDAWLSRPDEDIAAEWLAHAREAVLPRHLESKLRTRPAFARCLDLIHRYPPLKGPMAGPVAGLLAETMLLSDAPDLPAAIDRLHEWAKVGRVGVKAWPDAEVYEAIKGAFEDFREELKRLQPERFTANAEDLSPGIAVGKRFLRVTKEAVAAYQTSKRRHGVVDFDDLLRMTDALLRDNPEIRARLQDRYLHVLVDELQDTDPTQMGLVESLTGGGLTSGKLFAVGDHKQSIYRFRGADVSLFQDLARRVPHDGRQTLSVNFRSQPAVLAFVNELCREAMEDYEPLVAHQPQVTEGPCVEFLWTPRPEDISVGEARSLEAETIAARIVAMIDGERLVVDEQTHALRPVRAGDVVLLFRAMSSVHLYESALRRAGLDYYLVGGRAFFAQQEIHDLHNLLMALENPLDDLSLAGALRSPFFCLSDEAIFALSRHKSCLWSALGDEHARTLLPADQIARCRRARDHLRAWREQKDLLPIARLIDRILADTGYDAALQLEFLGERKLANLWKLLELARTFDRSGLFGLAEFAARLGDLIAAQPREEQAATQPENADVVRLMTIHQAKGLEFPVVFVPDLAATGGARHTPTAAWDARLGCVARPPADEDPPPFASFGGAVRQAAEDLEEWAEDVRTLYVACTRPRDYLVLSAALVADYRPAGPWMQTLAARFDLPSGECRGRGEGVRVGVVMPVSPITADEASRTTPPPPPEVVHRRGTASVDADELARRLEGDSLFGDEAGAEGIRLRRLLDACDFRAADGPLAGSPLGERLARARRVRRRVEFSREGVPGVHGTADCLFEDESGWHLVEWVVEPVPAGGQEEYARRRGPILALAASALGVRSAIVAFVREGTFVERAAGRLARAGDAERVRRMLAAMAGEVVADVSK